jgi:N-acetylglucosamine kinase-like BadF-type ATPase
MRYFLGADLGATKTHTLIVDETGRAVGFGESGPGNHETVGYDGMFEAMQTGMEYALKAAGLVKADIAGAGFGVAGFDWPSEYDVTARTIDRLDLSAPYKFVNDAVPGLVAGSEEGWGVVAVSGTGSNCRGWDREHRREGRVTGHGVMMGEGAGASELMFRCMQIVGYSWTKRGPTTRLADALIELVGAKDLEDLIRGYTMYDYQVGADAAPLVFRVADEGDAVARELIRWAGCELGEMVNAVIRQLDFEDLAFDVVMTGSMFEGGQMLIEPMRETVQKLAPQARLVRLKVPPVLGAVMLGMEAGGNQVTRDIRDRMNETVVAVR